MMTRIDVALFDMAMETCEQKYLDEGKWLVLAKDVVRESYHVLHMKLNTDTDKYMLHTDDAANPNKYGMEWDEASKLFKETTFKCDAPDHNNASPFVR